MGQLFAQAFTEQSLLNAWGIVRDGALADGEPNHEVDIFEKRAAGRVVELAEQLAAGEWEPQPVRRVDIPKSGGGFGVWGFHRWRTGSSSVRSSVFSTH